MHGLFVKRRDALAGSLHKFLIVIQPHAGDVADRPRDEGAVTMLAEHIGVDVLLGPGVNHKRSPLGGRNFEYYSEDPLLSGKLAAAYIKGLQEQGIAVSLKHFAVNSREYSRQIYDAVVDERALHEIYLRPFEIAVKEGKPKTIMCAYNKVNGVYACENKKLMDTARSWGFDGIFISDWEAVSNPVHSYNAGLGLEMPGHSGSHVLLEKAYEAGQISDEIIAKRSQEMNSFMQW